MSKVSSNKNSWPDSEASSWRFLSWDVQLPPTGSKFPSKRNEKNSQGEGPGQERAPFLMHRLREWGAPSQTSGADRHMLLRFPGVTPTLSLSGCAF